MKEKILNLPKGPIIVHLKENNVAEEFIAAMKNNVCLVRYTKKDILTCLKYRLGVKK